MKKAKTETPSRISTRQMDSAVKAVRDDRQKLISLAMETREQVSAIYHKINGTVYPRAFHTPISAQMAYVVSALGLATMILTNVTSKRSKEKPK